MLIAVVSSPNHVGARESIRQTYGLEAASLGRVDVLFFVGQLQQDANSTDMEQQLQSEPDVIRFYDFIESYHNLSYKALDIYKYGYEHGYRSVFKVDDDTL